MGSFWASLVHDDKPVEDVLRSQWIINGVICFSRTFLLNVVSGWEHKMFDEGQTAVVVLRCIWLIFNSVRLETCEIHISLLAEVGYLKESWMLELHFHDLVFFCWFSECRSCEGRYLTCSVLSSVNFDFCVGLLNILPMLPDGKCDILWEKWVLTVVLAVVLSVAIVSKCIFFSSNHANYFRLVKLMCSRVNKWMMPLSKADWFF